MAEISTIARPYAEAAFKLAKDQNALASWSDAIARLAAIASRPELKALLGNPAVGSAQLANLVAESAGQLTETQRNFVSLLVDNERVDALSEVATQYEALRNGAEGVVEAHVESAYPLTEAQLADITATLTAKYGKQMKVVPSVNAELIGGVSIRVGDAVTDVSVRGKLAQLATALAN
jgi:F-type H+-transporting ATPase subunit delta